jgi:hypothetical protein
MSISRRRHRSHLMFACAVAAFALTGCGKSGDQKNSGGDTQAAANAAPPLSALPLASGAVPVSAPAPLAQALPSAPPVRYASVRSDRYAYLDRAYALGRTFSDAPPDYTYDYDNERPLVWRSDDGYQRVAEQLPDGGVRYYYYQPGAEQPYLVQDPDYSYGYSEGALTVVYDANGNIVSDDVAQRQVETAARYLARAQALYAASVHDHHEAVAQENWNRQRERVYADQVRWQEQQARDTDWRAYHQAHQDQDQAHWAGERYRRAAEAARFAQTISDTVVAARAAQALADSTAEVRRYGQDVRGSTVKRNEQAPGPSVASPSSTQPVDQRPGGQDRRGGPGPQVPAANPAPAAHGTSAAAPPQTAPQPPQAAIQQPQTGKPVNGGIRGQQSPDSRREHPDQVIVPPPAPANTTAPASSAPPKSPSRPLATPQAPVQRVLPVRPLPTTPPDVQRVPVRPSTVPRSSLTQPPREAPARPAASAPPAMPAPAPVAPAALSPVPLHVVVQKPATEPTTPPVPHIIPPTRIDHAVAPPAHETAVPAPRVPPPTTPPKSTDVRQTAPTRPTRADATPLVTPVVTRPASAPAQVLKNAKHLPPDTKPEKKKDDPKNSQ